MINLIVCAFSFSLRYKNSPFFNLDETVIPVIPNRVINVIDGDGAGDNDSVADGQDGPDDENVPGERLLEIPKPVCVKYYY